MILNSISRALATGATPGSQLHARGTRARAARVGMTEFDTFALVPMVLAAALVTTGGGASFALLVAAFLSLSGTWIIAVRQGHAT